MPASNKAHPSLLFRVVVLAAAFLTPCGLSQLSGSWVSVSWAQTEAPRTLAEALARAEESNTTILNAKQVLEQRYGAVTEARSLLLPRLDVTANYSVQDQALVPAFGGQTFGSDRNWDSRATVRQRLFGVDRVAGQAVRFSIGNRAGGFQIDKMRPCRSGTIGSADDGSNAGGVAQTSHLRRGAGAVEALILDMDSG